MKKSHGVDGRRGSAESVCRQLSTEVCLRRERDAGSCSLKCCFEVQTLEELNADGKG